MYVKYETDEEELQKKIWDNIHNELKKECLLLQSWLIRLKIVTSKGVISIVPTDFLKLGSQSLYYNYRKALQKKLQLRK